MNHSSLIKYLCAVLGFSLAFGYKAWGADCDSTLFQKIAGVSPYSESFGSLSDKKSTFYFSDDKGEWVASAYYIFVSQNIEPNRLINNVEHNETVSELTNKAFNNFTEILVREMGYSVSDVKRVGFDSESPIVTFKAGFQDNIDLNAITATFNKHHIIVYRIFTSLYSKPNESLTDGDLLDYLNSFIKSCSGKLGKDSNLSIKL